MVLEEWRGEELGHEGLESGGALVLAVDGELECQAVQGAAHGMAVDGQAVVVQQVGQHKLFAAHKVFLALLHDGTPIRKYFGHTEWRLYRSRMALGVVSTREWAKTEVMKKYKGITIHCRKQGVILVNTQRSNSVNA